MAKDDLKLREIGRTIAERRRLRGMTQRQLADAVGVSARAVQSWEQGQSHPYRHLRALEQALGSTTAALEFPFFEQELELADRVELHPAPSDPRVDALEARLAELERRLAQLEQHQPARRAKRR